MGVTIQSDNYAIDLGYGGFNRLRTKVAELAGIYEHYKKLDTAMSLTGAEQKKFFEEYDQKTAEIQKERNISDGVMEFLYKPDCNGSVSFEACRQILDVIKDYDDNILYGYTGRPDCAKFKDFKNIVEDCIKKQCCMEWF